MEEEIIELCKANSLKLVSAAKVGRALMVVIKGKNAKDVITKYANGHNYNITSSMITKQGLTFYIY